MRPKHELELADIIRKRCTIFCSSQQRKLWRHWAGINLAAPGVSNNSADPKYLFPVKAMSAVYRGKFMSGFKRFVAESGMELTDELKKDLYAKQWVVYAKRPFGGASQIIEYLGRYTHKVAISNHRLESIADGRVSFRHKDYRDAAKTKVMTLSADEFLRRFCLHILPPGFPENQALRDFGFAQ